MLFDKSSQRVNDVQHYQFMLNLKMGEQATAPVEMPQTVTSAHKALPIR